MQDEAIQKTQNLEKRCTNSPASGAEGVGSAVWRFPHHWTICTPTSRTIRSIARLIGRGLAESCFWMALETHTRETQCSGGASGRLRSWTSLTCWCQSWCVEGRGGLPRSSCAKPDQEGQKSWDISVPLVGPPAVVHVCWQRVRRQIGSEGSRSPRAPRRGPRAFQSGLGLNISGAEKSGGGNGARGWAVPGSTDTTHTANHRPTTVQRSPPMNEWRAGTSSTRCRRCLQSATGGTGPGLNYRCLPVRVRGAHPSLRQPHDLPLVSPSGSRGG